MKSRTLWSGLMALVVGLSLCGTPQPGFAQERDQPRQDDRLERLERRLNELAIRQEHLMQRLSEGRPMAPSQDALRPPMPQPPPATVQAPMPPPGPSCPLAAKCRHGAGRLLGLLLLVGLVINILIAVWIFSDIRKRGEGHGIFIVLALIVGIPTAIIYALVRIGDRKP
jgi:hypothetical protein